MSRSIPTLLAIATILFGVAPAQANMVLGAKVELSETDAVIAIETTDRVGEPELKLEKGRVRIWLPNMRKHPRLDVPGAEAGFDAVKIRPGASGLVLIDLRLPNRHLVPREAIRFEAHDHGMRILIGKSALPIPGAKAEPTVAAPLPIPTATDPANELANEPAKEPVPAPTADAPSNAVFPLRAEAEPVALGAPDDSSGTMGMLLLLSVLLGSVYALVRYVQARRGLTVPKSDIHVVSVRRLGPKHQLVLVRALGEEHLLSVTPAGTQRLRSSSTASDGAEEDLGLPTKPAERSPLATTGLRAVSDDPALPGPSFQSEVLRLSGLGRAKSKEEPKKPRVIGGEQARSLFPKEAPGSRDSTPSPGNDSVAGILRLRRRNGR